MSGAVAAAAELEVLWRAFAATGEVPSPLQAVQGRLVRSVHRGTVGGRDVFVKAMTFPRAKDRLRYLLRPLPARHEAAMLARVAAAGIACPEVVLVRTARRWGLPWRSWLVIAALPVVVETATAEARLTDEARAALALLAAGIAHRDLHADNFVRLADGRLAVLDLQSVTAHPGPLLAAVHRLRAAARLTRDVADRALAGRALAAAGLVRDAAEQAAVDAGAAAQRRAFAERRVRRCLGESTEFAVRASWRGREHRCRGELPPGRWIRGGGELRRAWIGQREQQVFGARSPLFPAFFQNWWWLGGRCALYVPHTCPENRITQEVAEAVGTHRGG